MDPPLKSELSDSSVPPPLSAVSSVSNITNESANNQSFGASATPVNMNSQMSSASASSSSSTAAVENVDFVTAHTAYINQLAQAYTTMCQANGLDITFEQFAQQMMQQAAQAAATAGGNNALQPETNAPAIVNGSGGVGGDGGIGSASLVSGGNMSGEAEGDDGDDDSPDSDNVNDFALRPHMSRNKRRRLDDIPMRERWKCSNEGCGREYKRTSTTSIGQHKESCPKRPIIKARAVNQSSNNHMPNMMSSMGMNSLFPMNMSSMSALNMPMSLNNLPNSLGSMNMPMNMNLPIMSMPIMPQQNINGMSMNGLNGLNGLSGVMNGMMQPNYGMMQSSVMSPQQMMQHLQLQQMQQMQMQQMQMQQMQQLGLAQQQSQASQAQPTQLQQQLTNNPIANNAAAINAGTNSAFGLNNAMQNAMAMPLQPANSNMSSLPSVPSLQSLSQLAALSAAAGPVALPLNQQGNAVPLAQQPAQPTSNGAAQPIPITPPVATPLQPIGAATPIHSAATPLASLPGTATSSAFTVVKTDSASTANSSAFTSLITKPVAVRGSLSVAANAANHAGRHDSASPKHSASIQHTTLHTSQSSLFTPIMPTNKLAS